MHISRLDHVVLTVQSIAATCAFYERVLGMEVREFGTGRTALFFGEQRINLHQAGSEISPHAALPTPGSADLCFLSTVPMAEILEHLARQDVNIEEGPVLRSGAMGPIDSVYFRDPDNNLIELSCPR